MFRSICRVDGNEQRTKGKQISDDDITCSASPPFPLFSLPPLATDPHIADPPDSPCIQTRDFKPTQVGSLSRVQVRLGKRGMDLVQKNIFVFGGRTDGKEAQQHKREKERTTEFGIGRGRGAREEEEGGVCTRKKGGREHAQPPSSSPSGGGREGDRRSRFFFPRRQQQKG